MADTESLTQKGDTNVQEDWDDDDDDDDGDDYEDDGDDDIDAEAEAIAARLGAELWADLSKTDAQQPRTLSPTAQADGSPPEQLTSAPTSSLTPQSRKGEAIIVTMRGILAFIANDPRARSTLASTIIPNSNGFNVLDTLNNAVTSGIIPKGIATHLSQTLVSLARSEDLFGKLRHSNASAIQLDKGKRKRDETEEDHQAPAPPPSKRPYIPTPDLHSQVTEAVRVIAHAFGSTTIHTLDPSLVSSVRLQLHQVFLFAVTSSAGGGPEMHALQEISGLIQVIGVLSGIQIGQAPDSNSQPPLPPDATYPWISDQPSPISTDIGTAVYPCLHAGCRKTFSRLYSLRAHQRVHAMHRPFRCNACPASFARNHDLKRHIKLHEKKAWKCGGCLKMFSRRDAIKRHKNGSKTRGPKSEACINAEVVEVELNEERGDDSIREERRAKIWNGIASSQGPPAQPAYHGYLSDIRVEEGEIQPFLISSIQSAIMSLHGLLQAHVGNALGSPVGQSIAPPVDPTGGQATLASVIARAQLQNMPPKPDVHTSTGSLGTDVSQAPSLDQTNDHVSVERSEFDNVSAEDIASSNTTTTTPAIPALSMYGLSDEQTKMLEQAIANAASAAQAQAEAEAALEEEEEMDDDEEDEDGYDGSE